MAYSISSDMFFTYGVVDRVGNMLTSYVLPQIEAQSMDLTSLKHRNDYTKMKRILSELCVALAANTYKSQHTLPERLYRFNLQRIRAIAYNIEDMLDAAENWLPFVNFPFYPPLHLVSELQKILHTLGFKEEDTLGSESESADSKLDYINSNHKWFSYMEDTVVGRESEKQQIIDWIFSSSNQGKPTVISVTGVGGIGKTTLARLVYNDAKVLASFQLLSWAFTASLDIRSKLIEIVRAFTNQSWYNLQRMETRALMYKLYNILAGKKYLLVLDDIELEHLAWWEELLRILKVGSTGSTVIVTTKWETVSRDVRSTKCFEVKGLPEDECWSFFTCCAGFTEEAQQEYPLLKCIGTSIVNKCYGCPLAIKTLGTMLVDNRDERLWNQANDESNLWAKFAPAYDAHGVSFKNMSCELAQCLVGSAILPGNKLMSREQLVYFWMALGLMQSSKNIGDPRDVGDRYCNQLLFQGFFHVNRSDGQEMLQLNHAARQLAVDVMQQDVVSLPGPLLVQQGRHLVWAGDSVSVEKGFDPYSSILSKVRTFLFKKDVGYMSKMCVEELISKLSLVRVLFLDGASFDELPETIGNLKLLRYLSVAGNYRLKLLPDSICNLVHLQTLDLSGCQQLQTVPKYTHNWARLRNLFLSMELTVVPVDPLLSWRSLHHLKICECPNLISLSLSVSSLNALQVLQIHDCSSIASLSTSIDYLRDLKELSILNCNNLDLTESGVWYFPKGLQFLLFQGLPKLRQFPEGLPNSANSLRHLTVRNCENLTALPEYLRICINLFEMVIDNCPNLCTLPRGIKEIQTLQVLKILNCPKLIASYQSAVGVDWDLISHIPRIQLQHQVIQNRATSTSILKKHSDLSAQTAATPKPSKYSGCSKIAQDGSGLCIGHAGFTNSGEGNTNYYMDHPGGKPRRCRSKGCHLAATGTIYCKAHGGGRKCQSLGCTKLVGGSDTYCNAHGGSSHFQYSRVIGTYGLAPLPLELLDYNRLIAHGESSTVSSHHDFNALNLEGISLITAGSEDAVSTEKSLGNQDVVKEVECPLPSLSSSVFQEDRDLAPKTDAVKEMKYYCSTLFLLPENYEIEKETLIQLWMADKEYIKDDCMEPQEEEEVFSFVLNNGYLVRSGSNFMTGKSTYRINITKINELLDSQKDKESSYLKWDNEYQQNNRPASESIRHVSLVCTNIDETIFKTLHQFKQLRTLLFLANLGHRVKHIPDQLFLGLHYLQALDLSRTQIKELPSSIGGMIYLRYLDLSWTLIEWLPDTICSLVELQTLKLRGCFNLLELPVEMKRLTKLQHLDFDVLRQLEIMPRGIGNLVNLQTLSAFLVGTEDGSKIQELKGMNKIAGSLCIAKLELVEDANEAREVALYKKEQLEKLELRWTSSEFSGTHNNSYTVLEYLQPCTRLEELRILCYEGATFPSWISNSGFNKLVHILFYRCENLVELPLIEQLPYLKHLGLTKMNSIAKIECREKDVAFPKLEKLEINEMQSLRVWNWKKRIEGDFTSLTQLIINDCFELEEFDVLPHLSSIKLFEIRECPNLQSLSDMKLPDSLEELVVEDCPEIQKKCLEEEGEDWYKIKHVPTKNIQELD